MRSIAFMTATLLLSLSTSSQACRLSASVSDQDFLTEGVAKIVLHAKCDSPKIRRLTWQCTRARNMGQGVVSDFRDRKTGLSWNAPQVATRNELSPLVVDMSSTDNRIELFDVLGERELQLQLTVDDKDGSETHAVTVKVGPGPMSVFETPFSSPLTWFELYRACNGPPFVGNAETWQIRGPDAGGTRMPGGNDIKRVSGKGKYNKQSAWGAALAAGWPNEPLRWWLGSVSMANRARHIDITDGNTHGFGGQLTTSLAFGVCLKQHETPHSDVPVWTPEQRQNMLRRRHHEFYQQ